MTVLLNPLLVAKKDHQVRLERRSGLLTCQIAKRKIVLIIGHPDMKFL